MAYEDDFDIDPDHVSNIQSELFDTLQEYFAYTSATEEEFMEIKSRLDMARSLLHMNDFDPARAAVTHLKRKFKTGGYQNLSEEEELIPPYVI